MSEVLTHVFENRAHTCLQAEIISTGGDNADDGNDRTQVPQRLRNLVESRDPAEISGVPRPRCCSCVATQL